MDNLMNVFGSLQIHYSYILRSEGRRSKKAGGLQFCKNGIAWSTIMKTCDGKIVHE